MHFNVPVVPSGYLQVWPWQQNASPTKQLGNDEKKTTPDIRWRFHGVKSWGFKVNHHWRETLHWGYRYPYIPMIKPQNGLQQISLAIFLMVHPESSRYGQSDLERLLFETTCWFLLTRKESKYSHVLFLAFWLLGIQEMNTGTSYLRNIFFSTQNLVWHKNPMLENHFLPVFHCWRYKEPYSLSGCTPEVCVEPGDAEKVRTDFFATQEIPIVWLKPEIPSTCVDGFFLLLFLLYTWSQKNHFD